jgi:hypothetical protein
LYFLIILVLPLQRPLIPVLSLCTIRKAYLLLIVRCPPIVDNRHTAPDVAHTVVNKDPDRREKVPQSMWQANQKSQPPGSRFRGAAEGGTGGKAALGVIR